VSSRGIDPGSLIRALLLALAIGLTLLYSAFLSQVSGTTGPQISKATQVFADDGRDDGWLFGHLPGAAAIAGWALFHSFDPDVDGGCLHLMFANNAIRQGMPKDQRERLLSLVLAYVQRGADPDRGCDDSGAPPLWNAVLDLDEVRITLLLAAGAHPAAATVVTDLHPLGLDLRGLIGLMRIRHAAAPEVLARLDRIEAQLFPIAH